MKNTEKLNNLLNKLEKYNVYLYDNGTALYFMHTPTERKTRFFRNTTKNLPQIIEDFAENMLKRFEKSE